MPAPLSRHITSYFDFYEFSVFSNSKACSKSHPGCNMVDCLQLVAHTGGCLGPSDAVRQIHDEATFGRDVLWLVLYDFDDAL